jgi:predicted enzyme related to lactoylglutathione lyase
MKTLHFVVASIISFSCFSQATFVYEPYFPAIVVNDLGVSVEWYKSLFGLKVKTESTDIPSGYKVAILESENMMIELMELRGSLPREQLLTGKPEGTQIQGLLKIGFKVPNIDSCLKRLSQLHIEVPQVWEDKASKKRNFLIKDPDGNLIQFFD